MQVISCMRHYLSMVQTPKHREAITSMLLSTHRLAVEILRYTDHAHQPVPRANQLCRFCTRAIESPEHALLECNGSEELVKLITEFLTNLFAKLPNLQGQMAELTATEFLSTVIFQRATICLLAKYVYEVFEV